ncbi:hypothetical protein M3D71_001990 [Micrococcus luteus]|nr:hypothetical protein [Micrococcus luteus]MCV7519600.1 hypothetical protein [Micrococcus luteus]
MAGRWRAGAALTIRGEFSLVIAGLAASAGGVPPEMTAFATACVLALAVAGPVLTRYADAFGRLRARAATRRVRAREVGVADPVH